MTSKTGKVEILQEMCTVRARIDNVRDNGKTYNAGEVFHMHQDLVPIHVKTGQAGIVETEERTGKEERTRKGEPEEGEKQLRTPKDKQQRPVRDKEY